MPAAPAPATPTSLLLHGPVSASCSCPVSRRYDIKSLSADRAKESCEGIADSQATILKLIAEETASGEGKPGLAASRIALAGFSQGGAMSMFVGLNYPTTLAGMLVMSGYLPVPDSVKPTAEALATPLLHCHGDADGVVPLAYGRDAHERAKTMGVKEPQFKVYRGLPHSVSHACWCAGLLRVVAAVLQLTGRSGGVHSWVLPLFLLCGANDQSVELSVPIDLPVCQLPVIPCICTCPYLYVHLYLQASDEELRDVVAFFKRILPAEAA